MIKHDPISVAFILIDDNEIDQLLHRKLIELNVPGASVRQFFEAGSALNYVSQRPHVFPDYKQIILLDIKMPVMDGFAFLEEYAKLDEDIRNAHTIYLLSSSINQFDISRAKSNLNVADMIIKPLTKETLLHII